MPVDINYLYTYINAGGVAFLTLFAIFACARIRRMSPQRRQAFLDHFEAASLRRSGQGAKYTVKRPILRRAWLRRRAVQENSKRRTAEFMPFQEEELMLQTRKLIELRHQLRALYAKPGKTIAPPGCAYLQAEDCFLLKVHSILEARFGDENFGIHDLCQALAMSRTQLYRKFHALTNQSVSRYIRFFRLHKAKEMLENTSLNITQVALETGFKSQSYFSRIFVGEFGFPPSLVRKKHSN